MQKTLTTLFGAVVTVACCLSALHGEGEQPTVKQLVKQLNSRKYRTRAQAMQALRKRGPVVLPALRKASKHCSLEVHLRLQKLIGHFELVTALEPRRVTLKSGTQPLVQVLEDIQRQTGYKITVPASDRKRQVNPRIDNQPFWKAMRHIERQTGLAVQPNSFDTVVHLSRERRRSPFYLTKGAFGLDIVKIDEDRSIDWSKPSKHRGRQRRRLKLTLCLFVEPKLAHFTLASPRVVLAEDEHGKPFAKLKTYEIETYGVRSPGGYLCSDIHVPLGRPSDQSTRLRTLRLSIPFQFLEKRKKAVVIKNISTAKGTQFRIGPVTFRMTDIERIKSEERVTYKLSFRQEAGTAQFQHFWFSRTYLEDTNDNRLHIKRIHSSGSGNEIRLIMEFRVDQQSFGQPRNLVLEDWDIRRHVLRCQFKNVSLP